MKDKRKHPTQTGTPHHVDKPNDAEEFPSVKPASVSAHKYTFSCYDSPRRQPKSENYIFPRNNIKMYVVIRFPAPISHPTKRFDISPPV